MRKVLAYALVAVSMAFMLSACGAKLEGASSNIITGTVVSEEAGTITEIHAATLKALESLELPISYDKKDNLVAVLQTFTAEGDTIRITISYRTLDVSELRLFSEDKIDSFKMAGLLDEIRNQMSLI
ncbi:DUF3568 family protein [Desulfovibrio ferrophilus]|uniref:Alpha-1,2-galactosyltransferase n=1 Tax=Desulfovibrio ferrophilus TaxID=241368 RepID=A0A2Z6AYQ6_9BACT|nr:DUF3568 family protein [Desulfovibrio ferrophilus]BBD08397.1 alpha-1,2-galactosyltransferase [Desulfovibrio ferrophilus]